MAAATHEQKRDLFQSHFLLGKLEPGEIDKLATRARVESYRAGQEIFAKGSPGRTMIAVLQGSVKIVSLPPTGKEVVVHAGEVFGELAVITGEERSAVQRAGDLTRAAPHSVDELAVRDHFRHAIPVRLVARPDDLVEVERLAGEDHLAVQP